MRMIQVSQVQYDQVSQQGKFSEWITRKNSIFATKEDKLPDTTKWPEEDVRLLAAYNRSKRLKPRTNKLWQAAFVDMFVYAGPWAVGAAALAGFFQLMTLFSSDVVVVYEIFQSGVVISTLSSFVAFLLVSKQRENLRCNRVVVEAFEQASNACISIATNTMAQTRNGKEVPIYTYYSGENKNGVVNTKSVYRTSPIALICSSAMQILKYSGRGEPIWAEGLSLAQQPDVLRAFKKLSTPFYGTRANDGFQACIILLSQILSDFSLQNMKSGEYGAIFKNVDLLCSAEAKITSTNMYQFPLILDILLYVLYTLYLVLICVTNLVPENQWHSVWLSAIFAYSTIGYVYVSDRYKNPTTLSSKFSGQSATVSMTVKSTERYLNSIFSNESGLPNYIKLTRDKLVQGSKTSAPVSCGAAGAAIPGVLQFSL